MNSPNEALLNDSSEGTFGEEPEVLSLFQGELFVKNAFKSFGVTKALNGCSFHANFGEIHAIVGGNGCGKSTLAKVLSGVLPMDSGKLSVLGHHPTSPSEARKIGISTVFQEVMIADEATIIDNLYVGADSFWTKTLSSKEKYDKARVLMDELTGEELDLLAPAADLPLSTRAWITIARGLLCDPKVLILDESSAALDFDATERLFDKMRQLRDQGAAIIIVTHRIAELIRISDRATIMRDGRDVGVLAKEEITEENLLNLMTGREGAADKSSDIANKTNSRSVVLKTKDLQVWPDAELVDFSLLKGEIVGITGLDGHGQDDFVRMLAGVASAHDGFPELSVSGSDETISIKSLDEAKANAISFVSGDRKREGILPNMSIFENLLVPLYKGSARVPGIRFINWSSLADVFDWEVKRLSIKTGPESNLITSLSGGNQQKVMIGRSMALHPKILVLNDPARGIDVDTKRDLYQQLRDYASEGNSVIYASSELEEFIGFCSRVVVFRNGSIFHTYLNEEVEAVGILEGMFGRVAGLKSATTDPLTSQSTSGTSKAKTSSASESNAPALFEQNKPDFTRKVNKKKVKVVDFDKQQEDAAKPGSESKSSPARKMKITYFD
ncbi:MAG: ribose transport system ATP-binding protein [Saprospiraceae bacterium]|jgi:ribose transport system ATP-binding protein